MLAAHLRYLGGIWLSAGEYLRSQGHPHIQLGGEDRAVDRGGETNNVTFSEQRWKVLVGESGERGNSLVGYCSQLQTTFEV
jgi:hypothetical protein